MYINDCKLIGLIKEREGVFGIQRDIYKLQDWAKTWQMSFNYEKCKVMNLDKVYLTTL